MSNLTSILSSDLMSNAPSVLTGNFQNLNQDKLESNVSSVLAYGILTGASSGPSRVASSILIGSTGQVLVSQGAGNFPAFKDTSNTASSVLTLIPAPVSFIDNGGSSPVATLAITSQSVMSLGKVVVPFRITTSILAFMSGAVTVGDTLDLTLYAEDGSSQVLGVTSSYVGVANSLHIVPLPSTIAVSPGIYYLGINANTAGVDLQVNVFDTETSTNLARLYDINSSVAGSAVVEGSLPIGAGTPPGSITPSVITAAQDRTLTFRINK